MNARTADAASTSRDDGPPSFIVGCPRSGTTLLAALCDRHSEIAATPESHFFSRFCKSLPRRERYSAEDLARRFAESQYTRDLNLSSGLLLERIGNREVALADFYRLALDAFARSNHKRRSIEKTPEHLHHVDQILDWYPEARIVCIVRDGRDTALSLRNMPWSTTPLRHYAALWRESAIAALRCQRKWPDQFLTIRYEDLLGNAQESLAGVMSFLGVNFEAGQLDPARGTGVVPGWEMQVKKNVFSEIDPSRAYAWKRTATPGQLRGQCTR